MKVEFFHPLKKIPTATAQEKGINHKTGQVYTLARVREVKALYTAILLKYKPKRKLEGAICLKVSFRFPISRGHKEGDWKITKPDTDNMLKLLKDCGTRCGYWQDDNQIAFEVTTKKYSKDSGIVFLAEEMEEQG